MQHTIPVITVSVRELVEFVFRTGNLGSDRDFSGPNRALQGVRGHQRLQRSRPPGYRSEQAVRHEWNAGGFLLRIRGRVDGILESPGELVIEEIKTVINAPGMQPDPMHWAQGKIYAWLQGREKTWDRATVKLTYLDLASDETTQFLDTFTRAELEEFFQSAVAAYLEWARGQIEWLQFRNQTIQQLQFPYSNYRAGQRPFAVAVYRAIAQSERLFAEAPTGIGKTMSVLFPAIKALAEGHGAKIFYLTAKTSGRNAAETAVADLRQKGLRFRTVTLTARDKICFNQGQPCDLQTCAYALGYYDRIKPALRQALEREALLRPEIEQIALDHRVCPFALSLDASIWADAVICDYNYLFDPKAQLRRHFDSEKEDYIFLIDEAHNLPDRARDMFSAELDQAELLESRRLLKSDLPDCARALAKISASLTRYRQQAVAANPADLDPHSIASNILPKDLSSRLQAFLKPAEAWLSLNHPADFRPALLQTYFRVNSFLQTAALYDARYRTILESGARRRIRLFCLDPSSFLRDAVNRGRCAIFFSATLTPVDYFKEILGGASSDKHIQLGSPFPPENFCVLVENRIATGFKERQSSFDQVALAIGALVGAKPGNYLVFFPSYKYLEEVLRRFQSRHPSIQVLVQAPAMAESERDAFLNSFRSTREQSLIGFALLGGIFGEGIDLTGENLLGAIVVGVGLPQLSLERNLMRDYFNRQNRDGFDYAYAYPGMNRVLQAVGRVIRSETDRGVALLIDRRFALRRYAELLPPFWSIRQARGPAAIAENAAGFWGKLEQVRA
jgi:DNA excision repair protein ERCC-2